ncbi:hypothetical protein KLP40_17410 [Hymenobacter sp. NST-14]|uniref:hypothetical protein n=1 Tax=Hymenobacter piscis TaxID=2839984 RepID=UPI001C014E7D|nr:hypothetical protein [Hymenobacter piscis]MBT9394947.1 hypothetical protein [Hymenobacter piscis]
MILKSKIKEHWRLLVLFFVVLVDSTHMQAQTPGSTLFPLMSASTRFTPRWLDAKLPRDFKVPDSYVRILPEPYRRNNKLYSQLAISYGEKSGVVFTLRQQADTVWLAMDTQVVDWDSGTSAQRLPLVQENVRQLQASYPALFSAIPTSLEESVLFRFNARIGEKWICYASTRQRYTFYRVELQDIIVEGQAEPQYVFNVSYSGAASHTPSLLKITVSKSRGIRGLLWYDYLCGPQLNCADVHILYGQMPTGGGPGQLRPRRFRSGGG